MSEIKSVEKKEQTMRYSDVELGIIKATFSENGILVKAIRKVMLDAELDEAEKEAIKNFRDNEAGMAVLTKTVLPTIDPTAPLHQLVDLYVNIDTKEKGVVGAYPLIVARDTVVDYISDRLAVLDGTKKKGNFTLVDLLDRNVDMETRFSNLSARNTILVHIDSQMVQLQILGGLKTESVDQTKARLAKIVLYLVSLSHLA